jgi:hypothetical protein
MFTKEINIRWLMTSEYCIKPHVIAAEITKHRSMKIEITIEDEGWDFVKTGIEDKND